MLELARELAQLELAREPRPGTAGFNGAWIAMASPRLLASSVDAPHPIGTPLAADGAPGRRRRGTAAGWALLHYACRLRASVIR